MSRDWDWAPLLLAFGFAFSVFILMSGCAQPQAARVALMEHGFTGVKITGYDRHGCAEDEDFRTGFEAVLDGVPVKGTVCRVIFSSPVVRFQRRSSPVSRTLRKRLSRKSEKL